MAYTKTNWKDGDVISAEKMNKIEQGIEDAGASSGSGDVFVVDSSTPFTEMYQAVQSGKAVLGKNGLVIPNLISENESSDPVQ